MKSYRTMIAAFVLVIGAYVGLYGLLVEPYKGPFFGIGPWQREANCRLTGDLGDYVFWPINQLDRSIRPDTWTYDPYVYDGE